MKPLGLNEIRTKFRDFYVSKDHYPGQSASLVPKNDKSLLLINSGMAPLKPYFSGAEKPPKKRMTTCQKCIRTGDIDNVGKTARHGTFFEMLGNFSFGDYFKTESLHWGWELITQVLEMDPERIWATVYLDDDEAVAIWKEIGIPEERIVRLGKEDNFWEIGLGPCGPCSEMYFDRGEEYGCGKPDCKPGCDCDRYLEFWNHVFTQFDRQEDGSYEPLEHPNIDTGMGLERMACIMQGVDSIFDIDTVRHILDGVVAASGVEYADGAKDTDVSIRIITDHLRSMVFMIADGILPSNEGRGYVLRRLIRRASRHGKLLGMEDAFLTALSNKVMEVSGEAYPELLEKKEYIQKIISVEEEKFAATIDQGCEIINQYIQAVEDEGGKVLSGDQAFKLYDTYGFPLELTQEILEEKGMSVDEQGFSDNMARQKEMARKGRKNTEDEAWKEATGPVDLAPTIFTGYEKTQDQGKVLAIYQNGQPVEVLRDGQEGVLYLDQTPFYAESGGQVYDNGIMTSDKGTAQVTGVTKSNGIFAHGVRVNQGKIQTGDVLSLEIDGLRRNHIRRNHTATHLLHKALREVLGTHVEQAGSSVTEKGLRFDFSHFQAVTPEELQQVQNLVNAHIYQFLPVNTTVSTQEEAVAQGAMALFGEKYGDKVRVVACGDWSVELCGGTHVDNTGEIGVLKIVSESGVASGVRRIEALTGAGVLAAETEARTILGEAAGVLKCTPTGVADKVLQLNEEARSLRKALEESKRAAAADRAGDLLAQAKEIQGKRILCKQLEGASIDDLRNLSDDIQAKESGIVLVFATVAGGKVTFLVSVSDDLTAEGVHAGKMVKEIAAACGGGGGGKANFAQAGGKDPSKIGEAFAVAENLLR